MSLIAPEDYYELILATTGDDADIWVARLADTGFDSFTDDDGVLKAYLPASLEGEEAVAEILAEARGIEGLVQGWQRIAAQNWNQTWEDNFQPVVIAGKLQVRARHHQPDPSAPIQILIEPKMSFGTGHHATTSQVAAFQLGIDHTGKTIIDAGSGTGILAILAEMLGASRVLAFDHEEWAVANAIENAAINDCSRIEVQQADLDGYDPGIMADGMLANITRNLVIQYLPTFSSWLKPAGWIITSGYYEEDLPAVREAAEPAGLRYVAHTVQDRWCAARFDKV